MDEYGDYSQPSGEQNQSEQAQPAQTGQQPPASPPRRRTNWGLIIGIALLVLVLLIGGFFLAVMFALFGAMGVSAELSVGPRVGVISISGPISAGDDAGAWPFGGLRGARTTMSELRQAAEDSSVKAVVLRINSPGGSAAASQAIYKEIQRLTEHKPVVVSMADVAASGGYYVACPADAIFANPATITGSIGVIFETLNFYEFMEKYGLESETIKSGKYKDTGSPFRPMRPDERELLKETLMGVYDQFVRDVAQARGMDETEVKKLADGRIYTGEQALAAGLIDELGNFYDAVDEAAKRGGIEGRPKLKQFGAGSPWSRFFDAMAQAIARQMKSELVSELSRSLTTPQLQPQYR